MYKICFFILLSMLSLNLFSADSAENKLLPTEEAWKVFGDHLYYLLRQEARLLSEEAKAIQKQFQNMTSMEIIREIIDPKEKQLADQDLLLDEVAIDNDVELFLADRILKERSKHNLDYFLTHKKFGPAIHQKFLYKVNFSHEIIDYNFDEGVLYDCSFSNPESREILAVSNTSFKNAQLFKVRFDRCYLKDVSFIGVIGDSVHLSECILLRCDFSDVKIEIFNVSACQFSASSFLRSRFKSSEFVLTNIKNTQFNDSCFNLCRFQKSNMDGVSFINSEFNFCFFNGKLKDVNFSGAQLKTSNVFREKTVLGTIDFTNADIRNLNLLNSIPKPEKVTITNTMMSVLNICGYILNFNPITKKIEPLPQQEEVNALDFLCDTWKATFDAEHPPRQEKNDDELPTLGSKRTLEGMDEPDAKQPKQDDENQDI